MKRMLQPLTAPASTRRMPRRVVSAEHVWVYWRCDGRDDVARVRNLSVGGIFLETPQPRRVGASTNLHFLVQEGTIRAEATVQHAKQGQGLGLKFTAVRDEDRKNLISLMARLRLA
jgi:hypothetical protein